METRVPELGLPDLGMPKPESPLPEGVAPFTPLLGPVLGTGLLEPVLPRTGGLPLPLAGDKTTGVLPAPAPLVGGTAGGFALPFAGGKTTGVSAVSAPPVMADTEALTAPLVGGTTGGFPLPLAEGRTTGFLPAPAAAAVVSTVGLTPLLVGDTPPRSGVRGAPPAVTPGFQSRVRVGLPMLGMPCTFVPAFGGPLGLISGIP